jgi:hypothetical protein
MVNRKKSLTFTYRGFIVTLSEPLTDEEEVELKKYFDRVRSREQKKDPNKHLCRKKEKS